MENEYQRREKVPTDTSEALVHETSPYYKSTHEKRVGGYAPHPAEKESRGEPRELFSMQSSYTELSIGADKKGDMMLTGSARRRHNAPMPEGEERRVEGSRRKKHSTDIGELYTNPSKPDRSAFAFRVDGRVPEKKLLRQLRERAERHDLGTFNETLSFFDVKEDEERLCEMRRERVSESEKQALEKAIRDKKGLERRLLKNLRLARKKFTSADLDELRAELFGETPENTMSPSPLNTDEGDEDNGEDGGTSDEQLF